MAEYRNVSDDGSDEEEDRDLFSTIWDRYDDVSEHSSDQNEERPECTRADEKEEEEGGSFISSLLNSFSDFTIESSSEDDEEHPENETQVYSIVRRFIEDNFQHRPRYLKEWRDLILGDEIATQMLYDAIRMLETIDGFLPDWNLILNALTFSPPSGIRAMIVAHDPIPYPNLATGLAFSFPREPDAATQAMYDDMVRFLMGRSRWCTGISMARMKQALMQAGVETDSDIKNFCYEHWAERGVLLWNSALTIKPKQMHHNIWLPFTKRLLTFVLEMSHKPILGMFWGSSAKEVYDDVAFDKRRMKLPNASLFECYDHPTFRMKEMRDFMSMAVKQFKSFSHLFRPPSHIFSISSYRSPKWIKATKEEYDEEGEDKDDHAMERNRHYRRDDEDDHNGGDAGNQRNDTRQRDIREQGIGEKDHAVMSNESGRKSSEGPRKRSKYHDDIRASPGYWGPPLGVVDVVSKAFGVLNCFNPFNPRSPLSHLNPLRPLLPGVGMGLHDPIQPIILLSLVAIATTAVYVATMNPAAGKAAGKATTIGLSFLSKKHFY